MTAHMVVGGERLPAASGAVDEITSPWDGRVVGTVPRAGAADCETAVAAAVHGAARWRRTPAHERQRRAVEVGTLEGARPDDVAAARRRRAR